MPSIDYEHPHTDCICPCFGLSTTVILEWVATLRLNIRHLMGAKPSADEHQVRACSISVTELSRHSIDHCLERFRLDNPRIERIAAEYIPLPSFRKTQHVSGVHRLY